jgi:hypothetical protein
MMMTLFQRPALEDVVDRRSGVASDLADLGPEFGEVSHARVTKDGHHSMAGAEVQGGL